MVRSNCWLIYFLKITVVKQMERVDLMTLRRDGDAEQQCGSDAAAKPNQNAITSLFRHCHPGVPIYCCPNSLCWWRRRTTCPTSYRRHPNHLEPAMVCLPALVRAPEMVTSPISSSESNHLPTCIPTRLSTSKSPWMCPRMRMTTSTLPNVSPKKRRQWTPVFFISR